VTESSFRALSKKRIFRADAHVAEVFCGSEVLSQLHTLHFWQGKPRFTIVAMPRAAENEAGEQSGGSPMVPRFCTGKLTHAAHQFLSLNNARCITPNACEGSLLPVIVECGSHAEIYGSPQKYLRVFMLTSGTGLYDDCDPATGRCKFAGVT